MASRTEDAKTSLKTATTPIGSRAEDTKVSLKTATTPIGSRAEDVLISLLTSEIPGKPWTSLIGLKPKTVHTSHVHRTRPR